MGVFKQWMEEMTSTASVAKVPMRMLSDGGKPYIGVPGRPSPYDKKKRSTVIRRDFPEEPSKVVQNFPYKWLKDQY